MTGVMTLTFGPSGTGRCLYGELIDLSLIGALAIRRATRIEFDNRSQCWRVHDRQGHAMFNSPSRTECLDWERQYFNNA